ncbi:MAG: hypothetical protein H0T68_07325 [Gemmatimonadales bacterium]|nr:hypothetical protein [Gemmatimonadales bacterium]
MSLALLLALVVASPATDSVPEPALVELRIGRLASRTVQAFRVSDRALLPLVQFLELAGIEAGSDGAGGVTGLAHPGEIPVAVSLADRAARFGTRRVALAPGELHAEAGELYLDATRLGELLEVRIVTDWSDLLVSVPDPESLPVAVRRRRESARAALLRPRELAATALPLVAPDRSRWTGFVLDYSWLVPGSDPFGGASYALAAGTDAFGGSLELGLGSAGRVDGSWLGVWRTDPRVTQLRLGDGTATGPRSRSLRGVAATNAPFLRPSLVGTIPYSGRLPAGWQVEVYRGGELVGFDSVAMDGSFATELPVLYGENPVDLVAYGPFGETRTISRTFRVSSALLPRGRFEYAISGGGCRFAPCRATGNLDLRYGLSHRWTAQAGVDAFGRDSLGGLWHPYVSAIGSVTNSWTVQLEGVQRAFVRSGVNYEPSLNLRLFGEYTRFAGGVAQPILNPLHRRSQVSLSGFYRPDPRRAFFYFEGSADHATSGAGSTGHARIGASVQLGAVRWLPYARVEREAVRGAPATTRTFAGFTGFLLPRAGWGKLLREVWVRTALEMEGLRRPSLAMLTLARPVTPTTRLEVGVSWMRGLRGASFTLGLSSFLSSVRSFTTVDAPSGGPASLTQLVQGSVLYDRGAGSVSLVAGPSLQRSGVAGRVFLDANGNGRYDVGEQGLPRVRIQVGSVSAYSDSSGNYRVWDVVPFEPVEVAPDSLSFESPLWVPAVPRMVLLPEPNRFTTLDLPMVIGGVVEGMVVRGAGGARQGVGGVGLVLTERRSGKRRMVTSFTDGSFYLLGVTAGEYELRVDARVLNRIGMTAGARRFAISPSGEGAPASLEVELVAGED